MGIIVKKNDEIKIRITSKDKKRIKAAAESKGMNMSEFVLNVTERSIRKIEDEIESKEVIENRIFSTEEKLSKLKEKMNNKREASISSSKIKEKLKIYLSKINKKGIKIGY